MEDDATLVLCSAPKNTAVGERRRRNARADVQTARLAVSEVVVERKEGVAALLVPRVALGAHRSAQVAEGVDPSIVERERRRES